VTTEKKKWHKRWWFRIPVLLFAVFMVARVVIPGDAAVPKTCKDLAPIIIATSKEQKNPLRPNVLKIYEMKKVAHPDRVLSCTGRAKLTNGSEQQLDFFLTQDADGDYFHGYEGR